MERIVVCGSGGMLGTDLVSTLSLKPGFSVVPMPHSQLDITDREAIRRVLDAQEPTAIVNAAAFTDVDGAENRRDEAFRLNALGVRELADYCNDRAIRLVHFSTDQVFDGKGNHPRTEEESPNPLNHYAATKLEGERWALRASQSVVLRVQWLYGLRKDRFSILKEKETFSPFSDQIGCPTWTERIADTVGMMIDRKAEGLFHFAHDDYASWAEVFQFVKEHWHLPVKMQPRSTKDAALPAARPLFSAMSNEKLKRFLNRESLGSWKTALAEFLDRKQPSQPGLERPETK